MYIKTLKIKNIRSFGETYVNFENEDGTLPQWTIILGDNGIGKSTILQGIAWMKPFLPLRKEDEKEYGDDDLKPAPIMNDEENEPLLNLVRKVPKSYEEGSYIEALFEAGRELRKNNDGKENDGCLTRMDIKLDSEGELSEVEPHLQLIPELSKTFYDDEVLIYGYSASRRLGNASIDGMDLTDTIMISSFISDTTILLDAQEILHTVNYAALDSEGKEREKYSKFLDDVKKMLVSLMPDFGNIEDVKIMAPKLINNKLKPAKFVITTKHGEEIPFENFSLGYKTVLSWVVDLAWRLFNKYSHGHEDPLLGSAIVLIDEIDLHLHPIWQTSIIQNLSDTFRNVQFIATAHSPLIVQSGIDANFAVLKFVDDHVEVINEPGMIDGWRIDQILASVYFDFDSGRGSEYTTLLEKRERLINLESLTDVQQKELQEVTEQLTTFPTGDTPEEIDDRKLIKKILDDYKASGQKLQI